MTNIEQQTTSYVQLHDENQRLNAEVRKQCEEIRQLRDEASKWRSESSRLHDELVRREQNNIVKQNHELRADLTQVDQKYQEMRGRYAKEWNEHAKTKEEVKRLRAEVDRLAREAQQHFDTMIANGGNGASNLTASERTAIMENDRVRTAEACMRSTFEHAAIDARREADSHAARCRHLEAEVRDLRARNRRLHDALTFNAKTKLTRGTGAAGAPRGVIGSAGSTRLS